MHKGISLIGVGCCFPSGELSEQLNSQNEQVKTAGKMRRYFSPGVKASLSATTTALHSAGLEVEARAQNIAVFGGQTGYMTPFIEEFAQSEALAESPVSYSKLWESKELSPFLVTHALNNNITGITGLNWNINGDATSFIRDQFGAHGALDEAIFSLNYGSCDVAIIPTAGRKTEPLNTFLNSTTDQEFSFSDYSDCAAVTLVLASKQWIDDNQCTPKVSVECLASGYQLIELDRTLRVINELQNTDIFCHYIAPHKLASHVQELIPIISSGCTSDLNQFHDADFFPGITTTLAYALRQLEQRKLNVALALDVDEAGFYSLVRIKNEQI